jgi:orotate phosphoribosyltransferase
MTASAARTSPSGALPRDDRDRLAEIIYRNSFGRGKITLASGKESDFYFDMKPSMLDPEGASLIARMMLAEIAAAGGDYVGGLEMGAVPITGAICQHSHEVGRPVAGFFVRKQAKGHGAKKLVEGLPKGKSLAGKQVVVVEDVTTTGDSALKALDACLGEGARVVLALSIVDREDGATQAFAARGIPFKALFSASEFLSRDS